MGYRELKMVCKNLQRIINENPHTCPSSFFLYLWSDESVIMFFNGIAFASLD